MDKPKGENTDKYGLNMDEYIIRTNTRYTPTTDFMLYVGVNLVFTQSFPTASTDRSTINEKYYN